VIQWLVNIGLGKFASILNAESQFSGKELLATSVEELVKVYKIDKKPAKKIIKERNKAMSYMREKKPRRRSKTDGVSVSAPFSVVHHVHVEFVPGRGLKGLPREWKIHLETNNVTEFISPRRSMSAPPLPLIMVSAPVPQVTRKRDSKRVRKDDAKYDYSIDEVTQWSREQVQDWLNQVDLPIFIPEFETARINGRMLVNTAFPDLLRLLDIDHDKLAQKLFKHITLLKGSNKRSKGKEDKENGDLNSNLNSSSYYIEIRASMPSRRSM